MCQLSSSMCSIIVLRVDTKKGACWYFFSFLPSDFIQPNIITRLHMATSAESTKVLCFLCNKAKGIYKCEGCSQIFCPKHSVDHRNELNKQLEEIVMTHDLVHQMLNQQVEDPQKHPLVKKINQWEKSAIDKIRQTAEKARNELFEGNNQRTTHVKQKLEILSNELREGRQENDFSEIDLQRWIHKLEELRKEILNPATIAIQEDSTSLVNNIHITRQDTLDVFERVFDNAEIKENGRLVVNVSNACTEIRGKSGYSTGRHTLRFRVEHLVGNPWIFFGIISKSELMQANSYSSSSNNGWATGNQTYVNGQYTSEQTIEITQNDVVVLLIDCDQRKIELKNERTTCTCQMSIDTKVCPFPWQFHLNLYAQNTCVRILPEGI